MRDPLTKFEQQLILSSFPPGSVATDSASFPGHNKRYPLRVTVTTPTGQQSDIVLRQDDKPGGSVLESRLLPVLERLGLPVCRVLAGPTTDPDHPESLAKVVFSLLTGTDLLRSCWDRTVNSLEIVAEQTLDAIDRVHGITDAINADPVAELIPRHTLTDEVQTIRNTGGPWLNDTLFKEALAKVTPVVADIHTPLVFSTGDYDPGNFLTDGERVTGYVDFAWACFEDPFAGIVRYWLNDWYPLNKVGIVEKFLYRHDISRTAFAPRLVVRALAMLQAEFSPTPTQRYPAQELVIDYLCRGMASLK
jgi:aminoglycoside phosphotransferase (APT) family kinase protein